MKNKEVDRNILFAFEYGLTILQSPYQRFDSCFLLHIMIRIVEIFEIANFHSTLNMKLAGVDT